MAKKVLDVGQCSPDHAAIRWLIEDHFDAQVVQAHGLKDTLAALRGGTFDLVLVNRQLDVDHGDGLAIIRQIKADEQLAGTPVMLVSNYPEHQRTAIAAGAVQGFGKRDLDTAETEEKLRQYLG